MNDNEAQEAIIKALQSAIGLLNRNEIRVISGISATQSVSIVRQMELDGVINSIVYRDGREFFSLNLDNHDYRIPFVVLGLTAAEVKERFAKLAELFPSASEWEKDNPDGS